MKLLIIFAIASSVYSLTIPAHQYAFAGSARCDNMDIQVDLYFNSDNSALDLSS